MLDRRHVGIEIDLHEIGAERPEVEAGTFRTGGDGKGGRDEGRRGGGRGGGGRGLLIGSPGSGRRGSGKQDGGGEGDALHRSEPL